MIIFHQLRHWNCNIYGLMRCTLGIVCASGVDRSVEIYSSPRSFIPLAAMECCAARTHILHAWHALFYLFPIAILHISQAGNTWSKERTRWRKWFYSFSLLIFAVKKSCFFVLCNYIVLCTCMNSNLH